MDNFIWYIFAVLVFCYVTGRDCGLSTEKHYSLSSFYYHPSTWICFDQVGFHKYICTVSNKCWLIFYCCSSKLPKSQYRPERTIAGNCESAKRPTPTDREREGRSGRRTKSENSSLPKQQEVRRLHASSPCLTPVTLFDHYHLPPVELCKLEDCPNQLTHIFILWYLYLLSAGFHDKYQSYKYDKNAAGKSANCRQASNIRILVVCQVLTLTLTLFRFILWLENWVKLFLWALKWLGLQLPPFYQIQNY